jgi:hypothetical protein
MNAQAAAILAPINAHARKCKKDVAECVVCKRNVAMFAALPLPALALALEDTKRPTLRTKLRDALMEQAFAGPRKVQDFIDFCDRFHIRLDGGKAAA